MGLKLKSITQNQKVTIRVELFAHLRVMLLFFSWAICMIAFFMWMIYAAMPNPKPALRFSFAKTLETFRKGTSRDADLLPPVPLSVPPVKPPISLPVFSPPDRLVANGPLPVSGLPSEPVRLAFAGKWKNGSRYYGKTKQGEYMAEKEAIRTVSASER